MKKRQTWRRLQPWAIWLGRRDSDVHTRCYVYSSEAWPIKALY